MPDNIIDINSAPQTSAAPADATQPTTPPQLSLNDLAATVQLIDVCSKRGAFEGPELSTIGALRQRITDFLKAAAPQQPAGDPGAAPAGVTAAPVAANIQS
jgi:hypothetical protein